MDYLIWVNCDLNSLGMLSMETMCSVRSELSAVALLKLMQYFFGNFHMAPVSRINA